MTLSLRPGALVEVAILRLGSQGDGIGELEGQALLRLPAALPGERWQVRLVARRRGGWDALPVQQLTRVERAEPACPHFGRCGGCRLQHLPPALYAPFKRERIRTALARRGLGAVEVLEPLVSPPGTRRRLRLAWEQAASRTRLGLRQRRGRQVVDLSVCPVAMPAIVGLLARLRPVLGGLAREGELLVTATGAGLDVRLDLPPPDLAGRERLADLAEAVDLARLTVGDEPLAVRREPWVELAGVRVPLPSGAFLQATAAGEAALQAAVAAATRPGARVLDLYAGLGTLGLAARRAGAAQVRLIEASAEAGAALRSLGLAGVEVERRDLVRRPLSPAELAGFDLVLLDPPRAGAAEQVAALAAASTVGQLVYAACDPESFARDARILADGGLLPGPVQPVDQFLWSAETELVAIFRR